MGPMIRPLNAEEVAIRQKYWTIANRRQAEAQHALSLLAESQGMLNDLALALNGGKPCVMTEDALYEVADGA